MKLKLTSILLLFTVLFYSCSSEGRQNTNIPNNPIDSFESAIPHGEPLPLIDFSDEDRIKLAKANGKKAESIPVDTLAHLVNNNTAGLLVFNFWNLDCQSCKVNIEIFENLGYGTNESQNFQVIHINTDKLYPDMLNSYIREKAILAPVYTIDTDTIPDWSTTIQERWDGQVPAVLIINNEEGIRLFYEKQFTTEEFQAILLPLTL